MATDDKFNGFQILGNRPSSLDTARWCGLSAKLSEECGAGTAAEISSAFHALAAGQPDGPKRFHRLPVVHQEQIARWKTPTPVEVQPGVTLEYEKAHKEITVGLDETGIYRDPTKQDVFLRGTADMAWVIDLDDGLFGRRVVFVGDLKKSRFASSGPDTLQTAAYGFGLCGLFGAEAFATGLWYLEESDWDWSRNYIELNSREADRLWDAVRAAAENTEPKAVTGDHCLNCWGRNKCEAWGLDALKSDTEFNALLCGQQVSPESLGRAAFKATSMKRLAEEALKRVQGLAVTNGIEVRFGEQHYRKEWRDGRESVDIDSLREKLGPDAERFIKKGQGFASFNWRKAK